MLIDDQLQSYIRNISGPFHWPGVYMIVFLISASNASRFHDPVCHRSYNAISVSILFFPPTVCLFGNYFFFACCVISGSVSLLGGFCCCGGGCLNDVWCLLVVCVYVVVVVVV